ncbi:MAG: ribosome biogenesis GTPase Der, partial [Gammaproteobacteria bacterium]|nr:ribosome biogenesis GTPase Der [Gammaproteobacteria bacterium]
GSGIDDLLYHLVQKFPDSGTDEDDEEQQGAKVAIVGRPNVGKSTLVNCLLGEERVLAYDMPGTTRDSIYIPFEYEDEPYTLIDTAGVRRRSRVDEKIEKFSVIKTLQAIDNANVVILVMDAQEGLTAQDTHVLGYVLDAGKALLIAINKWDGLAKDKKEYFKKEMDRKLSFVDFASTHFISALHGTGVGKLMGVVRSAYRAAKSQYPTPMLTRILEDAVLSHQPPVVKGRRIKLRYAHQGGQNPPVIVIHGNQVKSVPDSYQRYLANVYRKILKLEGTPVRIQFKGGDNPFEGRKNKLSVREIAKKKRSLRASGRK